MNKPLLRKVDADNVLVLIDLSKGRYTTDDHGVVTGVEKDT